MGPLSPKRTGPVPIVKERLDSWKEIAAYLRRDVRTVQRWARDLDLPVQKLPGGPKAGVFAMRPDLDRWLESSPETRSEPSARPRSRRRVIVWIACGTAVLLLVAVVVYGLAIVGNPRVVGLQSAQFTPFATSFPVQVCPAWSPDGKSIAFIGKRSGFPQLFVQGIDSATAVAITDSEISLTGGADPIWCMRPFWSPDSQWLYFLGSCCGIEGILRVSAGGGQVVPVQARAVTGTISADAQTLVFLAQSPNDRKFRVWTASPPEGPRHLYQPVPFAASSFAEIPTLSFAPHGRQILSIMNMEHEIVCQLLPWPPGPRRRVFPKVERGVGTPRAAWMPDSRHIVFSAGILGMGDTETGRYWPIAIQPHWMESPTASPGGSRVAYQSSFSHADVIAVPLHGGPIQTLLGSSLIEQEPAASPVAPQVVYVTAKHSPSEIWVKDLAQGWDRPLALAKDVRVCREAAHLLMTPVFSPDGRRVAFTAVSPAGSAIFTVPTAGGTPVQMRAGAEISERTPTWSPDGEWMAFTEFKTGRLFLAKARVGSSGAIDELAAACGGTPAWSPSGEWIAFTGSDCQTTLVSPDGKATRKLGEKGVVAWARDGKTLYRFDSGKHALMAIDIVTGASRLVRELGDLLPYSFPQPGLRATVTHDGASIVYSVLRPREEIWIMENVRVQEPWYAWLLGLLPRR